VNAFNEWEEKMSVEPSNEKQFYYLDLLNKYVLNTEFKKKYLVLTHNRGGGTEIYIDFIKSIIPKGCCHEVYSILELKSIDIKTIHVLHINALIKMNFDYDSVFKVCDILNEKTVPIYLTIHDYQWLFQKNPNPTIDFLDRNKPQKNAIEMFIKMSSYCKRIYFPSQYLITRYKMLIGEDYFTAFSERIRCSPNPDYKYDLKNYVVPLIQDKQINIAFVGNFAEHKGSSEFIQLSNTFRAYKDVNIHYFAFGGHGFKTDPKNNISFLGKYRDKTIVELLHVKNVHIVVMLGKSPETYSYVMSRVVNSGLTIVYYNIGSFIERLPSDNTRLFPFTDFSQLITRVESAIDSVLMNSPIKSLSEDTYKNIVHVDKEYKVLIDDIMRVDDTL
jgi:hypothetical protein